MFAKLVQGACLALATLVTLPASAQVSDYPNKPVRVLVGFAPGGAVDIAGRLMAAELQKALGKSFVVENKPGVGGMLALQEGARAPADGYTIMVGSAGPLTVSPSLFVEQKFEPLKALDPVILYLYTPGTVVVRKDLKANNLSELVALSKGGNSLNLASAGTGSVLHLMGEFFQEKAGVKWEHIPYKGSSPALADMAAGRVDVMLDVLPSSAPMVKGGQIRALAVTSKQRNPQLPNVPTAAEQGFPLELGSWMGIVVPKGTPPAIIEKLNKALNESLGNAEVKTRIAGLGSEVVGGSPAVMQQRIETELKQWSTLIEKKGIKAQ